MTPEIIVVVTGLTMFFLGMAIGALLVSTFSRPVPSASAPKHRKTPTVTMPPTLDPPIEKKERDAWGTITYPEPVSIWD